MANHYEVPSWAGKAPTGHHLDVTKDDKLIQKLMIDEKKCYLFGRNKQLNDFCIDHGSCSRVHAALVYHKHLNISYLVDLGSSKYIEFVLSTPRCHCILDRLIDSTKCKSQNLFRQYRTFLRSVIGKDKELCELK